MERQVKVYERSFCEWAKDRPEIVVLSADLTNNTEIGLYKQEHPDRFFHMGIAEQNMISWAGGLAREGYIPYVHTFGVFIYRLGYDQMAMSVAYPRLKVRFFGSVPGVTTPGGVTHQAIEDIGVVRSLPNMTIVEPADVTEIETMHEAVDKIDGPVYMRLKRGQIPRLFDKNQPFVFGKVRDLGQGDDLCILSSGVCTEQALYAVAALRKRGLSVAHLHVSTLKPFDDPKVVETIQQTKYGAITIENHNTIGGLGTCVAEVMAASGVNKPLYKLGIQDRFMHGGSMEFLMRKFKLDAFALVQKVEEIVGKKFNIPQDELTPEEFTPYVSLVDQL